MTCGQPPTSSEEAAQTTASSTSGPDSSRRDTTGTTRRRDPDSLADHPALAGARHPRCDNPLFYEEVNYAASAAFQPLSGDEQVFWDALAARGPRDCLAELGEDFDFDDDQEMRRRLPRLFRSIHSASRDLSSTAWLTNKPRSLLSTASKGHTRPRRGRTAAAGQARCRRLPSWR